MQFLRTFSKKRQIELKKNRDFHLFRVENVETIVTFQMKKIANFKCRNCANDNEIFKTYIIVKNHFKNACASYYYNSEIIHCSLYAKSDKYELL